MADAPLLDVAFRAGTIVLLLLLCAALLRDHGRTLAARIGAAFALGVATYVVCAAPGIAPLRDWWHAPLLAVSSGNAVLFWLFARAIFDDGFALRPWHALVWLGFALGALIAFYLPVPLLGIALAFGRIGFAILAVAQTVTTWRTDLVEGRRRLRGFIVSAIALHIVIDAASGFATPPGVFPPVASVVSAAGLLAVTLMVAWPLLRIAGSDVFVAPVQAAAPPPAVVEPPDAKLVDALQRLMTIERLHRREGLTIGALALKLSLPEYRLRRLINQQLGHRNFNAFLNAYRIQEAKQALAAPDQAEVPVLTIALDAGFQSLGPFNRAFKAQTGLTPSAYRRQRLATKPLPARREFEISKSA